LDRFDQHMAASSPLRTLVSFILPVWIGGCVGIMVWLVLLPVTLFSACGRRVIQSARHPVGRLAPLASPPRPLAIELIDHPADGGHPPRDTLLFVHGFPDGPHLWDRLVGQLTAAGYRCLVAALPGARGEPVAAAPTPAEIVAALGAALAARTATPVTLILHDWGCFYGLLLAQQTPSAVWRVVAFDVGGHLSLETLPAMALLSISLYQALLAAAYVMGGPGGMLVLRATAAVWRYPAALQADGVRPLGTDMAYHYLGIMRAEARRLLERRAAPLNYNPDGRPVLFAYAAHKHFMFHSKVWLARVEASPGGEVVRMPCGHWLMTERAAETEALVLGWLDRTEGCGALRRRAA
jgi:pimeloyl-ACP methyl ester carboxylesterase